MTDDIRATIRERIPPREQAAVARAAGITPNHLNDLLAGRRGRLSPAWRRLFDVLGLKLELHEKGEDG